MCSQSTFYTSFYTLNTYNVLTKHLLYKPFLYSQYIQCAHKAPFIQASDTSIDKVLSAHLWALTLHKT